MAINNSLYSGNGVTVGSTEVSVTAGGTTIQAKIDAGIITLFLEVNNIAAGDEYEIALYEKVRVSGDTARRIVLDNLVGAQADLLWISDSFQLGVGWDFGIKKIAGTDRTFSWTVRAVTA